MFLLSLGLEVLEVMPEPDVVVVCCGGGGLLAGVAAAIKLSGCDKTRIYGVEPEGGNKETEKQRYDPLFKLNTNRSEFHK